MMEGPGMSLFQGSDSFQLQLNTNEQRQEEEEAFEDQQRRNQELGNLLTNAFDDLIDDDDDGSSIVSDDLHRSRQSGAGDTTLSEQYKNTTLSEQYKNTSVSEQYKNTSLSEQYNPTSVSEHYKHCYRTSPGVVGDEHDTQQRRDAVPAPAAPQAPAPGLPHILYDVHKGAAGQRMVLEVDKWRRLLSQTDAERERLQNTVTHQAALVAAANRRVNDYEAEVATLKQNALNAENTKISMTRALMLSQKTSTELQSRCDSLESRLDSLHRGSVNEAGLDSSIFEAQDRLRAETTALRQQLDDASNNYVLKTVELDRLTRKMADLQREHAALLADKTETIDQLTDNLKSTQRQLQLRDQAGGAGTPGDLRELNRKLKEELERCIAGGRAKVEETKKLEEVLDKRDATLKSLQEKSTLLYNECKRFESENARLTVVNQQLESDGQLLKERLQAAEADERLLKERLQTTEAESRQLKQRLQTVESGSNALSIEEVQQLRAKLEAALTENEQVKRSYIEMSGEKEAVVAELTALMARRGVHINHSARSGDSKINGDVSKTNVSKTYGDVIKMNGDVSKNNGDNKVNGVDQGSNGGDKETNAVNHGKNGFGNMTNGVENEAKDVDEDNRERGQVEDTSTAQYVGSDWDIERSKLQQAFDEKMRETEELIKEETIKLFADELDELEGKRDAAIAQLRASEKRTAELEQRAALAQAGAAKALEEAQAQVSQVRVELDAKVAELREAAKRFDEFQKNCGEAFNRLKEKYQKKIDRGNVKYKESKKNAEEFKRTAEAREQYLMKQFEVLEDGYQSALVKVQSKIEVLLGIKNGSREL